MFANFVTEQCTLSLRTARKLFTGNPDENYPDEKEGKKDIARVARENYQRTITGRASAIYKLARVAPASTPTLTKVN